jgi:hypothetical protein
VTTPSMRVAVDAAVLLKDRLLILGTDDTIALAREVDAEHGGVVVTGASAQAIVRTLRASFPGLVLLEQPVLHTEYAATKDRPFPIGPTDEQPEDTLFDIEPITIDSVIEAQISNGASLGVIPTGFLRAGDHQAMTAVSNGANAITRRDVILHLPLALQWLTKADDRKKLIATIRRSKHPVVISLAHRSDPASQPGVIAGLLAVFTATPAKVGVWYSDLGTLEAIACGGLCGAIGIRSSYRHIVEPGGKAYSPTKGRDQSPNVLMDKWQRFKRSYAMTIDWFANGGEPSCACPHCGNRPLNRFTDSAGDVLEAHRHNLHRVTDLHQRLLQSRDRRLWWAELLADAEVAHAELSSATNVKIEPDPALKKRIALNPLPEIGPH